MRLVLLGPPGAGKGTQAKFVAEHFGVPTISTGDIFRANIANETELGKVVKDILDSGGLVPDEVTNDIVRDRLQQDDTQAGFLLDGFPRTRQQAETLQGILADLGTPLDRVLEMQVDDDEIVRRLSGRRICRTCGHVWHVDFNPPKVEGICDVDGGELDQRDDDQPETVRNRLHVYARDTEPLVHFYRDLGLLVSIKADGEVEDVTKRAISALSVSV